MGVGCGECCGRMAVRGPDGLVVELQIVALSTQVRFLVRASFLLTSFLTAPTTTISGNSLGRRAAPHRSPTLTHTRPHLCPSNPHPHIPTRPHSTRQGKTRQGNVGQGKCKHNTRVYTRHTDSPVLSVCGRFPTDKRLYFPAFRPARHTQPQTPQRVHAHMHTHTTHTRDTPEIHDAYHALLCTLHALPHFLMHFTSHCALLYTLHNTLHTT